MSNKWIMVVSAVVEEERRWEVLHPEILVSIFSMIPHKDMLKSVPLVCKAWMEVVAAPYFWRDIDLRRWCMPYNNRSQCEVDSMVKKLIRRSGFTVQRFSAYNIGESGFSSVAKCGRFLEVVEIEASRLDDEMVLKHLKPLPNLRVLDISNCFKFTAKALWAFGNQCKSLVYLQRYIPPQNFVPPVDDSEAKAIANTMPNLQRIELCFGEFGDVGLSEILTKCKSLKHLDIRGCWNVMLNGDVKKRCEKLECFRIHRGKVRKELWLDPGSSSTKGIGYKDPFKRFEARRNVTYE